MEKSTDRLPNLPGLAFPLHLRETEWRYNHPDIGKGEVDLVVVYKVDRLDVGLARLALGVEAVEILLQPLLRGLPGVDGAMNALAHSCAGGAKMRHL